MEIGWAGFGVEIWLGLGLAWCSSHVRNQREPLRAWLRLDGRFSRREVVTSWIFLLTALSMGHSGWPAPAAPRTGMKRKERAFILQVLQKKTKRSPSWVYLSPHPGEAQTHRAHGIGSWVPT